MTLNIWPTLPIIIRDHYSKLHSGSPLMEGADNIVAALNLKDRVHQISFWDYPTPLFKIMASAMLASFPVLTCLDIASRDVTIPAAVFPEAFLGGSAPRLQSCFLMGIPFPGIQKLLLSTNQLVELTLRDTPHTGYISPKAMVTCLSAMPNLKAFWLRFRSCKSIPDQSSQHLPARTPAVLPALTEFGFEGTSEYMEDLLPWINAPSLCVAYIHLCYLLVFDTPQLHNFLAHTQIFESCGAAVVEFHYNEVYFRHRHQFSLGISCVTPSRQLSSLVQICGLSFPPIHTLEHLDICIISYSIPSLQGDSDVENNQWLEFFRPFIALKCLCLDKGFARHIPSAL